MQSIPLRFLPSTLKNFPPPADRAVPPSMRPQGRETGLCLLYRICLDSTVGIQQWWRVLSPRFVVVLYARPFEVQGNQANFQRDAPISLTGQSQDNKPPHPSSSREAGMDPGQAASPSQDYLQALINPVCQKMPSWGKTTEHSCYEGDKPLRWRPSLQTNQSCLSASQTNGGICFHQQHEGWGGGGVNP